MAEARESPARSAFPRFSRKGGRPGEFSRWFRASWPTLFMLLFIFIIALFVRTYFGYETAIDNGYLVSGGSDSYYWERIIDYSADTGLQLYWDPMTNYPDGIRNPRPPFFSMSVVVPATIAEGMFDSPQDALGYVFLWSTAFWGALTVIPTYFLGKEAFGKKAGLAAALLLAIMPSHVQRSVFSNADHDSFILFFIVLTFYFLLKAVKTQEYRRWVESWKSPASVRKGLVDYFRHSRTPVLYSLMAGTAFGSVVMAWVGFGYVAVLILAFYVVQVLVNRFKNIDSTSVTIIVFLTMGFGYLLSFPIYYEQSLIPVRFDVPVYLFLAAIVFGLMFVVSRDYPWTLTLPAIFSILVVAVLAISVLSPALGEAILSGQGYFVKSKLYSTIAEARAPRFSELALSFGMITFFMSLVGLAWAAIKIPKHPTAEYIFMVAWLAAAIFMAMSAGRFMFNAAPAFAIAAAWVMVMIVDALDFNSVRRSLTSASGSFFQVFKKSVKIRHIVGALFLVFTIVLPNVWYAVDAGIPQEVKGSYDKQIYSSIPSFMRPSGYDEINGSNWYLGAFGYSLPLPSQYFPAAWEWFAKQDSDILPQEDRPAYVAWWDYGFECIEEGGHPTVADNFQYGYQLTGNVIMAQTETDAIALFAYRLVQSGLGAGGAMKDGILALFDKYGISSDRIMWTYSGPGQEVIDEVLADPATYGPMAEDLSEINARIVAAREELTSIGDEGLVSFYGELCDFTGWEIRYFNVDSRMFPISGYQTGIFYAPAKLSDRRISPEANVPTDFFEIKAVGIDGRQYDLEDLTPDVVISSYELVYKDMFYDSMFFRATGGYSGSDVGLENDGLPGVSGALSREQAMPGWNMSHFRVVYRTAYYNPYPPSELYLHRDATQAVSWKEAQELKQKISTGEILGYVYDDAYTLYSAGLTFLKYYHGAIVNGTLTTEEGYPVAGMRVTVMDEYDIPHNTVLTDAEGHYSVLAPFGNVTLVMSEGDARNVRLQGPNVITRISFNVTDAQAMREPQDLDFDGVYDFFITRNHVMRGTAVEGDIYWDLDEDKNYTASADELIKGVEVIAHELRSDELMIIDAPEGSFEVNLPPGQYNFLANVSGWTVPISEKVNVTAGARSVQNLALRPGKLFGNVSYEDGTPAAGLDVELTDSRSGYTLFTTTGEDGSFIYDRLINSNYKISTTAPGFIIFNEELQINAGNAHSRNVTAYSSRIISFKIVHGTAPVPYAAYMICDIYQPVYAISGTTDRFGRLSVEVPEGFYTLYATYSTGFGIYAGMTSVSASAETASSGTLVLKAAYNVTGALKSPTGSVVKDEYVFFESAGGVRMQAKSNRLGTFDLRLPADTYDVTASSQLLNGRYSGSIVVANRDIIGLQLRMEAAVVISGTLFLDLDGSGDGSQDELGQLCKIRVVDSAGRTYIKTSTMLGSFFLVVPKNEPFVITLADRGYSGWSETMSFSANEGGLTILAIPDVVTVSGRVSCEGVGLWGVAISFESGVSGVDPVMVASGPDGYYSVSLKPSTYEVTIDQSITGSGGARYQFSSETVVFPSQSSMAYNIQAVKRVHIYGQILNADEDVRIEFSGPEEKVVYPSGSTYSLYLVPGTYTVYAKGYLSSALRATIDSVELLVGSTEFTISLSRAYDVSGRITVDSERVSSPVSMTIVSDAGYTISMQSTNLGDYIVSLPPGEYSFSYLWETIKAADVQKLYVEYFAAEDVSVEASRVRLDVPLSMRMDNVTFSGMLIDQYGTPIGGLMELLVNSVYGQSASFTVTSSGLFSKQVQPGDYTVYVTRSQDGRAYLSTVRLERNEPLEENIRLAPGKHLSGRITVAGAGSAVELSVAHGNAKLKVQTDTVGGFDLLVPEGTYLLTASESRIENGMKVAYGFSKNVEVGATNLYVDIPMDRDTKRSVTAYWDEGLTQTVAPGQTVSYVFTVTNNGNIADSYLCTFPGTGHEVTIAPDLVYLDFGVNNVAHVTAEITVGDSVASGEAQVKLLARSKTLSSIRTDVFLYVKVTPSRSVDVESLDQSKPVSSVSTYTKFIVNNTGNIEDTYMVEVSNLPVLPELGWTAKVVDPVTDAEMKEITVGAFSVEELYVKFTATRGNPNPSALASVAAWSVNETGISSYGFVPVILPDLTLGPGDVTAERDDVSYEYDMSDIYLDIVLFITLAGLIVSFFVIRKKKGLGKGGAAKK